MASYDVFARFYDRFTGDVDYAARAAYFDSIILPKIGERGLLLDLACGTGSLSVELSKLGYEVIGVDGSQQMLSEAQQKAWEAGCEILFLHQRMEELDLYGTIDACVCALDSLNHLSGERALEKVLGRVSLFLAPGGVFVFDMNTPYKHREVLADRSFVYEEDDVLCVWRNRTEGLVTDIRLDFFSGDPSGRYIRSVEQFRERAFPRETVERIAKRCGLTIETVCADDGFDAPKETSQRYIFTAIKGE